MDIQSLLSETEKRNASDLHIIAGASPGFRINGELVYLHDVKLTPEITKNLVYGLLTNK